MVIPRRSLFTIIFGGFTALMTTRSLPTPHEPYVDKGTGKINEVWYRYLKENAAKGARTVLTEGTTFYVNGTTGSDITGDGSSGNPWAHPQQAYDYIVENVDGGGNWIKVKIADGTYEMQETEIANVSTGNTEEAVLVIHTQLTGVGSLTFEGDTAYGVVFNGFGCLHNTQGFIRFENIWFKSPSIGDCRGIFARAPGAVIGIQDGCKFGPFLITTASEVALHAYSQTIFKVFSPIVIAGGMHRFVYLEAGSMLDWENLAASVDPWVTIEGNPTIPYFMQLGPNSHATMINLDPFVGTFVGTKFVRQGGHIGISPQQHPNDLIPGTIDGIDNGWGNIDIDNNTGILPAFDSGLQLRFGGTSSGTFNVLEAYYIEYGPAVTVAITFNLTSKGAQTGAATIGPLPYPSGDFGAVLSWVGPVDFSNMNAPAAGWGNVTAQIGPTDTEIGLFNMGTAAGGGTAITDVEFNNNSSLTLTITYFRTP
jgi:hypothetical protein